MAEFHGLERQRLLVEFGRAHVASVLSRGGVRKVLVVASLFTAAKILHLGLHPQGQPERYRRVLAMIAQMHGEGFGARTCYLQHIGNSGKSAALYMFGTSYA